MLVWDEYLSGDIHSGLMGTHDEDTRKYFKGKDMKSRGWFEKQNNHKMQLFICEIQDGLRDFSFILFRQKNR